MEACTLFGGPYYDSCSDIALDGSGNVYLFGSTFNKWDESTGSRNVPTTSGAYDREIGGVCDCFVAKFSSDLSELEACTLLGGSSYDYSFRLMIAKDGNVLVAGSTTSSDFPVTGDAMRSQAGLMTDGFICRLSPDLTELKYSTYLGTGISYFSAMAEDDAGRIYLSCYASGSFSSMPTTEDAFSGSYAGFADGYFAVLDDKLSKYVYASYIGGKYDELCALALGPDGGIYVVGETESPDFPTLEESKREQDDGNWFQSDGYVLRFKLE